MKTRVRISMKASRTSRIAKIGASFVVASVLVLPLGAQQNSTTDVAANPGRPTISTPATLTPEGYLQFETGVLGARKSSEFSSLLNANEVMKLTVFPRLELIFQSEPFAHYNASGKESHGTGGDVIGVQGVILTGRGARPTLAASYLRQVYGGDVPDVDIGSSTQSFLFLASADVRGFHYDTNYMANEMVQGVVRRAQFGQTFSVSHALSKRLSISGELWHFSQPFLHGQAAGSLLAIGYTQRSNLVFDVGFDRGLTSTSTRWQIFAGFTYLFPHRLWKQK